jgi:hypothetical protein
VTAIHVLTPPLDDDRRGTLVFAGSLVVIKNLAPLQDLARTTADLLARTFDTAPERAHLELPRAEFDRRASEVVRSFRRDPAVAETFRQVLQHAGVDVGDTFWDWLHLRVQPPGEFTSSGTLGWHRDTWASNVYAQTNWWAPILPVSPERTIAFCPAYWSCALANTSAEWDVARVAEMPLVPVPADQPDTDSETRIVIDPGDLLCFSGAHLHASVPNTTDRTRFSVEVRTVARADVRVGRGAPNVDGRAPRAAWHWFRGITSGEPLADLAEPAGRAEGPHG